MLHDVSRKSNDIITNKKVKGSTLNYFHVVVTMSVATFLCNNEEKIQNQWLNFNYMKGKT